MPAINADTVDAWKALAQDLGAQRPSIGRSVTIVNGKHKGKTGKVIAHIVSKFHNPFRYASEAQCHLREMAGRSGYVCRVRTESGEEFWVNAEYTAVNA